jgi:hypothetical protein
LLKEGRFPGHQVKNKICQAPPKHVSQLVGNPTPRPAPKFGLGSPALPTHLKIKEFKTS